MTYVLDQAHSKNSSEEDISTPLDAPPTFSEVITPPDEDEDYLDVMLQKMIDVLTLGVYKVRNKKQKLQKILPGVIESLPYSNFLLFLIFVVVIQLFVIATWLLQFPFALFYIENCKNRPYLYV